MKIAIIGAGFFGSTIALKLSEQHTVHLYEKENNILNGASKVNQFRFHMGFHYPRSQRTIKEIKSSYKLFLNFYSNRVFGKTKNYYAVSNKGSKTSYNKFLKTIRNNKLKHKITSLKFPKTSKLILTNEKVLDYFKFKKLLEQKIRKSSVKLFLKKQFQKKNLNYYDKIIICTYSSNNELLKNLSSNYKKSVNRFELIEKILIKLPKRYKNHSYVVIDGKFVCLDPYLGTNYHLLSDVKYSKIEVVKKELPNFKSYKNKYLNKKIQKNLKQSNFNKFIKHSSNYLPFLKEAKYVGSMFVIRALKKNVEKTDERTGDIKFVDKKIISVFSGKWNTCVSVANRLKDMFR